MAKRRVVQSRDAHATFVEKKIYIFSAAQPADLGSRRGDEQRILWLDRRKHNREQKRRRDKFAGPFQPLRTNDLIRVRCIFL